MRSESKSVKLSISEADAKKVRYNRLQPDSELESETGYSLDRFEGWLNSRELQPPK